jgi:hypothetical protein
MFLGDRNIKEMKIKCDNADNGCEWIGELRALDEHIIACDYAFLSCPNKCGVGDNILRKSMEKHKMEECPRRQYICPHCAMSGEYEERTTTHLEECPLMRIPCSNEGCSYLIARYKLASHCNECCEYEIVPCKFAEIGCVVEVPRKDLKKHEEDGQQHLEFGIGAVPELHATLRSLTFVKTPKLEQQIFKHRKAIRLLLGAFIDTVAEHKELKETVQKQGNMLAQLHSIIVAQSKEINKLKVKLEAQTCDGMSSSDVPESHTRVRVVHSIPVSTQTHLNAFKFTNYAERKSNDTPVYSPPFYSGPGGYKLRIKVYANGSKEGKGTHLSVYAYLMRGDNDDHLAWPFTGTVEVELLNQLKDDWHHSVSIELGKSDRACKRVEDDTAARGYGHTKYIIQSQLNYQDVFNCHYLKDDCLYFRMSVNCTSTPKPWLSTANVF